jgi:hypothetical protein
MQNWKKALMTGSATAATVMFLKRKHSAGLLLAGIAVGTVASEYPQQWKRLRKKLPDYIERGSNFLDTISRLGERLAEAAEGRGTHWHEAWLRRQRSQREK